MPLTVEVISYQGRAPIEPLEASFGQDGGTLGRSPENRKNHFMLPDPEQFISRFHASITFENGLYSLTDTSVDGTYIQNKNIRVLQDTIVLADGDQLRIGDYELIVHIPSIDTPESTRHDSFSFSEEGGSGSFFDSDKGELRHSSKEDSGWWPDRNGFEESAEQRYTTGQAEESPLHDAFTPPDVANESAQPSEIPKNFNFQDLIGNLDEPNENSGAAESLGASMQDIANQHDTQQKRVEASPFSEKEDLPVAGPQEPPSVVPAPEKWADVSIPSDSVTIGQMHQQAHFELLQIFLEAAGIKDTNAFKKEDASEIMKTVGLVFREMTDGLMAILRGRSELKSQLQVPVTRIMPAENNPLKFFRIVDETLKQLLTNNQPGFIDAKDAVRQGYADAMNHQLAITAGIQAAVIKLIERFDPQHYTKQFEEGVVFHRKAKAWDAYRQAYTEIANQALEDFFGESFARAYEAQIRKLRSNNNDG